jgi:hypothetical protein
MRRERWEFRRKVTLLHLRRLSVGIGESEEFAEKEKFAATNCVSMKVEMSELIKHRMLYTPVTDDQDVYFNVTC